LVVTGKPVRRRAGVERDFQSVVLGLARFYRWLVYHPPAGGKGGRVDREQEGAGFPDLVLVRAPRIIFAELKTPTGRVRPAQEVWLGELRTWNVDGDPLVEVYLWRPDDLDDIAKVLAGAGMSAEAGASFAAQHSPRGRLS
jgi:hypothetical protein